MTDSHLDYFDTLDLDRLNDFDPRLSHAATKPPPVKYLVLASCGIQQELERTSKAHGGGPDKPGTYRKPGVRMERRNTTKMRRWSTK